MVDFFYFLNLGLKSAPGRFTPPSFSIGLVKTESDFIVRSVEIDLGT